MITALCIFAGFAAGFAASTLLALRNMRRMRAARDAARTHAAQQARAIAQMREREAVAATNLVQLSAALQQAAAERGAAHVASVPPPMKFWVN